MWMPGALIGGLLAYQIYSEAWAIGAVVGALAGLALGRLLAKPAGDRSLAEVDSRLTELTARLDWIDQRLATVERGDQSAVVAAAPTVPAPPEPVPIESPLAPAESVAPTAEPAVDPGAAEPAPWRESVLWRWLTGGNTVVRVGIVILFFGVAFLLKYASERFDLPIELRLAGVAAGALVLLVLGW